MIKEVLTADVAIPDDDFTGVVYDSDIQVTDYPEPKSYLIVLDENATNILQKYALPKRIVEVRTIDKDKWHGQKGATDFDKGDRIECAVYKGQFMTGLTREEQLYLEARTKYDLSNTYNLIDVHPFYQTRIGQFVLENGTMLLDLSNPLEYIKFKMITTHYMVYSSLEAIQRNDKPEATHYIFNEEDSNTKEVAKVQFIKRVDEMYNALTVNQRKQVYCITFEADPKMLSDEIIEAKLINYKISNTAAFHDILNQPAEIILNKSLVIMGVNRNIISRDDAGYRYADTQLGYDLDTASKFMAEPVNQLIKARIIEHIKAK